VLRIDRSNQVEILIGSFWSKIRGF